MQLETSFGRFCAFGAGREGFRPDPHDYRRVCNCWADGGITRIVYEDPEPGAAINYFTIATESNATPQPSRDDWPDTNDDFSEDYIFCSKARLENVSEVQCFCDTEDRELTTGVLLTYNTGRQEMLGHRTAEVDELNSVKNPTSFHWKQSTRPFKVYDRDSKTLSVGFSSEERSFAAGEDAGWKSRDMTGEVIWQFDSDTAFIEFNDHVSE